MAATDRRALGELAAYVADGRQPHAGESAERAARRTCLGELAARALHARLSSGLERFFLRCSRGNAGLAETLAAESFVRLWDRLAAGEIDPAQTPVEAYARGIAANLWRRERTRWSAGTEPLDVADHRPSLEALRTCGELLKALGDCRGCRDGEWSLDERERTVIEGVLAGRGVHDLAAELGRDAAAVSRAKGRAIEKLRKCLEQKGYREEDLEAVFEVGGSYDPGRDAPHG